MSALLAVRDLRKSFPLAGKGIGAPRRLLRAVDGVSFEIFPGETLGLVGESGCGKSTVGKLLLRLIDPDSGTISFRGEELTGLPARAYTSALGPQRRPLYPALVLVGTAVVAAAVCYRRVVRFSRAAANA